MEMTRVLSQQEQIKLADGSTRGAVCHHNAVYHCNCITERKKHFSQQSQPERPFSQGKKIDLPFFSPSFFTAAETETKLQCFQN